MNDIDIIPLIGLTESSVVRNIIDNEWNRFADVSNIMSNGMKSVLEYSPNMTIRDFAKNIKERLRHQLNPIIDGDNPKVNHIFKKIDDWAKSREPNVESLYEYMLIDDEKKPMLLKILRKLIDGKKGKDVALLFLVCEYCQLMNRPPHSVLTSVFGDIGTKQSYNYAYKWKCNRNESGMITKLHMMPGEITSIKKHLSTILIVDN